MPDAANTQDFDAFIDTAWNDHAERPQEVADRLAAALGRVDSPERIAPFARIAAHVHGEHLGQWPRGIELLESLRQLPAFDGSPAIEGMLSRSVATLRYAGGDRGTLDALSTAERVAVLAGAASAWAGRNDFLPAIEAYDTALRLAEGGLPEGSPAIRALAIGGNNLAAALETRAGRSAHETAGMVAAAQGGLRYWKLAGTWLEEERAEYRLARSLLQANDAAGAMRSAERCLAVCEQHAAPAFERFFGHVVLALAQRAAGDTAAADVSGNAARLLHAQVPPDERQWCAADLAELDG